MVCGVNIFEYSEFGVTQLFFLEVSNLLRQDVEARELLEEKEEHEALNDVPLLLYFSENTLPFKFQRVMLTPNHTPEFILQV